MSTHQRERFNSRLGFILVSAGCAVGLGNVWKFPYLCGQNGGAAFIIIYLLCLLLLAAPILVCELAVGRASQKSSATSFAHLKPKGTHWNLFSYLCMAGTYLLMAFYTGVCGWMLFYFFKFVKGDFNIITDEIYGTPIIPDVGYHFGSMLTSPSIMITSTVIVIATAFGICSLGIQKGVERITKWMMSGLFLLLIGLTIHSVTLPEAYAGIKFYLVPNFQKIMDIGLGNVLFDAMSQAFFTLSIGIGAIAMFGSYIDKQRSLTGEAITITLLDTIVALMAGLIIIPACFAFGIPQDAGPSLIFITMPKVFMQMTGGQFVGSLFFLFLVFAALSTVVAVFENILAYSIELWHWSRKKAVAINLVILSILSMPCVLGFNVLAEFQPFGQGSNVLDLEDFLVSNNFLPLGALAYLMFCVSKNGWGWKNFLDEVDTGVGLKFPAFMRRFMQFVLPAAIVIIYIKGYYDKFSGLSTPLFLFWMGVGLLFLIFIAACIFLRSKSANATDQIWIDDEKGNPQSLTDTSNG